MALPKGVSGNPAGKPKGTLNKTTTRFKEALNVLFEENADNMIGWLAQIEEPEKRFAILKDFAEYLYPKLARQEITGKDGEAIEYEDVTVKGKILSMLTEEQLKLLEGQNAAN